MKNILISLFLLRIFRWRRVRPKFSCRNSAHLQAGQTSCLPCKAILSPNQPKALAKKLSAREIIVSQIFQPAGDFAAQAAQPLISQRDLTGVDPSCAIWTCVPHVPKCDRKFFLVVYSSFSSFLLVFSHFSVVFNLAFSTHSVPGCGQTCGQKRFPPQIGDFHRPRTGSVSRFTFVGL